MGFFGGAVVREVAAQQQRVGGFSCLREEGAQGTGGILGDVDVANDGEAHVGGGLEHGGLRVEVHMLTPGAAAACRRTLTLHEVPRPWAALARRS